MRKNATVRWSENEPPDEVSDVGQLDDRLDKIAARLSPDSPTIVEIQAHEHVLTVGLGLAESFVQIQSESRMPPYLVAVGDSSAGGAVAFCFMGSHHTEIARRHLISTAVAREVLREFLRAGQRPAIVEWEAI